MVRFVYSRIPWWKLALMIIGGTAIGTILGHVIYYMEVLKWLP